MEPKHVITLVVGTLAAVLLVRWGWREFRRDWQEQRRLPLVPGPYAGGTFLAVLGVLAAAVPVLYAIFTFELVPKDSPALFAAMFIWLSLAVVFAMLGALSLQLRKNASGWLTVVGDDSLRIDANGTTATLQLRPGTATLRFIEGGTAPQYVQLDVDDGTAIAHVWGMVGIRHLKLVTSGRTSRAQGLMVGTSMSPLCRWLAPFLAKG